MVQWLRCHAPNVGAMGSIVGWGSKTLHAVCGQKTNKNNNKTNLDAEFKKWVRVHEVLRVTTVEEMLRPENKQNESRLSETECFQQIHMVTAFFPFIWRKRGFPGGSDCKESACNAGDSGSIPGSGRSPREVNGNSLQCSCLENSMDD